LATTTTANTAFSDFPYVASLQELAKITAILNPNKISNSDMLQNTRFLIEHVYLVKIRAFIEKGTFFLLTVTRLMFP
jgi:hypothetical protein